MTRRTRTFADASDADVFRQVAGDHGLAADVDVTGPSHRVVAQLNQSDLAFLRERARAIDAELWVEGRTLKARSHAGRDGSPLRLGYGNQLRELSVLADLAHQRTSVAVSGWDVAAKGPLREEAAEAAVGGELRGGESGSAVLAAALGDRKEAVVHAVPFTSEEAQARAEALFRRRARRFLTGRGIAETTSKLRVGAHVRLEGLGPLFSGDFYVSDVKHVFDGALGLRTEFAVERPGLGRAA